VGKITQKEGRENAQQKNQGISAVDKDMFL
jgi:hypothetical protein